MSYSSIYQIDLWVEKKFGKKMEINIMNKIQEFLVEVDKPEPVVKQEPQIEYIQQPNVNYYNQRRYGAVRRSMRLQNWKRNCHF